MALELKNYRNRHTFVSKLIRAIWGLVWFLAFRPTPRGFGFRFWRTGLLKLFGAHVSWSSNVRPSCRIWLPSNLAMGAYACLGDKVDCYNVAPISLGDNATVSQCAKLCTASHDVTSHIMELTYKPIVIGADAWVAAWSIVLPGVTIGSGSVVAAGAVVSKDVEKWTIVGGNPAQFLKVRKLV